MKKYIGLIFSAVLLVALAVGCSGSFGFDGKDSVGLGTETGGGNDNSGYNPFKSTVWEDSTNGDMLSFYDDTCIITEGTSKTANIVRATTSISVSTGTYSYTCKKNGDGSFTATLKYSSGAMYATFTITASGAVSGTLKIGDYTYTFGKKTGTGGGSGEDESGGGTTGGDEPGADDANRFEIKDGVLVKYNRVGSETAVTIPDTVKSIGSGVFKGCSFLTSMTIPLSVESIGKDAFTGCSFASVRYAGNSGNWRNILCYYDKQGRTDTIGDATGLKGKRIVSTIKDAPVPKWSFDAYVSIWKKTDGNNTIGMQIEAFPYKMWSTDIKIPEGATSINDYVFSNCADITSVTIPNSVKSIGERAFAGCASLTSLVIPDSVTSIEFRTFESCYRLASVTIPDSVTSIGEYAFENCGLTSIEIPESVTEIGRWAFKGCSSLASVTIPAGVTKFEYAFIGATGLKTVKISEGVTSIDKYAFAECSNLESIEISESVGMIDDRAFNGCSRLTSVTIPAGVTKFEYAFFGATGLETVKISEGVTSIGVYAFAECSNLKSIEIPKSVESIGTGAIDKCAKLESVYYSGTQEQWNNIKLPYFAFTGKTIICSDGKLTAK